MSASLPRVPAAWGDGLTGVSTHGGGDSGFSQQLRAEGRYAFVTRCVTRARVGVLGMAADARCGMRLGRRYGCGESVGGSSEEGAFDLDLFEDKGNYRR
jgi:hypothetical protein